MPEVIEDYMEADEPESASTTPVRLMIEFDDHIY